MSERGGEESTGDGPQLPVDTGNLPSLPSSLPRITCQHSADIPLTLNPLQTHTFPSPLFRFLDFLSISFHLVSFRLTLSFPSLHFLVGSFPFLSFLNLFYSCFLSYLSFPCFIFFHSLFLSFRFLPIPLLSDHFIIHNKHQINTITPTHQPTIHHTSPSLHLTLTFTYILPPSTST